MQAFLLRHLVPANEFAVTAYPSGFQPITKRVPPTLSETSVIKTATKKASKGTASTTKKFTKSEVVSQLRRLKRLYEAGYLADEFYLAKVAECEPGQ